MKKLLIALATIFGIVLVLPNAASATYEVEKTPICHNGETTRVNQVERYVHLKYHEGDYDGECEKPTTTTSTTTTTTTLPCEWNSQLPPNDEECVPPEETTTTTIFIGCIIGCDDTTTTTTTEPVDETTTTTTEVIDDGGESTTTTPVPPTDPPTTPPTTGVGTSPRLPDTGSDGSSYAAGMGAILLGLGTGLLGITKLARR